MAEYRVLFVPAAEEDILSAYDWGCGFWGSGAAEYWLRDLYQNVFERLARFPFSCPLAPESAGMEVRQLILGRYRVLYEVSGDTVIVLGLAGPAT